jgi:hypothetical protein
MVKLDAARKREWNRTIEALRDVCRVLDAGFDPITPPKNWARCTKETKGA